MNEGSKMRGNNIMVRTTKRGPRGPFWVKIHLESTLLTQKSAANVFRYLVARLGFREMAQLLIKHSFELEVKEYDFQLLIFIVKGESPLKAS